MVNEDVEVIVGEKLRRKGADGVSYCDLFAFLNIKDEHLAVRDP